MKKNQRLKQFAQDAILRQEILKSLNNKADGMFLIVKLQMDILGSVLTKNKLLTALTSLPASLDALYAQTVEKIKEQPSELREIGLAALAWVAFAKRPLTVLELRAALAIPATRPKMPEESDMISLEDILGACYGLLTLNGDTLRLVHFSTQEFMQRIQQQEFPTVHDMILRTLLDGMHRAKDSGDFEPDYYPWDYKYNLDSHPLLHYCRYILHQNLLDLSSSP
uniref:GPI inositol-deacylase winged helix domain-containing protein n=1 Tax=Mycena chlorophos TaxID=658473 RepID=A0ABQ0LGT7_MYCCL|nr:predicted protein [Mycena chlorophos]